MRVLKDLEWKWNVPNALSIVRLLLLPLFVVLFLKTGTTYLYASIGVLVLSGITDALDGLIARRFNQITPIGKLLDPIADKMTQVAVVICVAVKYTDLFPLAVLCLLKEGTQGVGGIILLNRGVKPQSSKWYGKVSTVVFYIVMAAIILFDDMPQWLFILLVTMVAALMIFAFVRYFMEYLRIRRLASAEKTKE